MNTEALMATEALFTDVFLNTATSGIKKLDAFLDAMQQKDLKLSPENVARILKDKDGTLGGFDALCKILENPDEKLMFLTSLSSGSDPMALNYQTFPKN